MLLKSAGVGQIRGGQGKSAEVDLVSIEALFLQSNKVGGLLLHF
jgi:hypothetical protein